MKKSMHLVCSLSLAAACGLAQTARADSMDATCEFYKHGEEKPNKTGDCTFSQRQGNIDIDLRSGQTYSLTPTHQDNHFKDRLGNKVVRTHENHNKHVYKWDNKRIVVFFRNHDNNTSHRHENNSSDHFGETPHKLRDLVGARAGQAEDQLHERGYKYKNGSSSGNIKYSNWKERSTGRCVTIRTEDGRYKSIIYSSDFDCNNR